MFRLTNGQRLPACPDSVPESVDLDSVFNRLQVNPDSTCRLTNPNTTTKPTEDNPQEEFQKAVGKKLKEKWRKEKGRKSIIRKSNLVLPKTSSPKESVSERDENQYCDTGPCLSSSLSPSASSSSAIISPDAPVSCGAQHAQQTNRQTQGSQVTNDDANAEELASYFEQMLVIPKPMSLMAEMMYA